MKNLIETERIPALLSRSEQLYFLLLDPQGHCHYANRSFALRFGTGNEGHLLNGNLHPGDRDTLQQAVQELVVRKVGLVKRDLRIRDKSGEWATTSWELVLADGDGDQPLVHCLGTDSTARQTQQDPQALLEQLNAYLNGVGNLLVVVDQQRRITRVNKTFAEIAGRSYKDLQGEELSRVLPPGYAAVAAEIERPRLFEQQYSTELPYGEERWCEFISYPNPMGTLLVLRDITDGMAIRLELEQSKKELERQEQWLRNLLMNSVDAVFVTDPLMNIRYSTSSVANMLGYEPDELMHTNAAAFIHPDDLATAATAFREEIEGKTDVRSVDFRVLRKDGTWVWVEGMGKNRLNDGVINGMIIYLNDIEERKKAEDELAQNERKYKAVVDTSYNGIVISDKPGKMVSVNPAVCRMFGYTEAEFMALTVQDFLDFSDQRILKAMDELHRIGHFHGEVTAHHKSGRRFLVEIFSTLLYNDQENSFFSTIVRDIDEERRMQRQVQQRETILSAIATATSHLVTGSDMNQSVPAAMDTIGTAMDVDRVYIFEVHSHPETGEEVSSQRFEWTSGNAAAQINNPDLQLIPMTAYGTFQNPLRLRKPFVAVVKEIDDVQLQALLASQDIVSILALPVFIQNQFWGFVGFDDCHTPRRWQSYEIDILHAFAATLAGAIERSKSEQLITESQQRYQQLFDENPVPLLSFSTADLQIRNVNTAALEHYGYSRDAFIGMQMPDLCVDPRSLEQFVTAESKGTSAAHTYRTRHRVNGGRVIDVELTLQPLSSDDKDLRLVLVRDITESLRLQRERDLLTAVTDLLIRPLSMEENLQAAVQLMRRYFGWDLAELWIPNYDNSCIKLSVCDLAENDPLLLSFYRYSAGETFTYNEYGTRPFYVSQRVHWIEELRDDTSLVRKKAALEAGLHSCIAAPVRSMEQVVGLLYFFSKENRAFDEDVTRLLSFLCKELASEILKRRKEAELDIFFSVGSDGMVIAGADGSYKKVNPAFCRITGYSEEELFLLPFLKLVHPDDLANSTYEFQRLLSEHTTGVFENRIITKTGEVKWLEWTSSYDPKEKIIVSSARDFTEKKLAETQLASASEILNQALQENKKILEYSQDIIATFTRDGVIMNINPVCEAITGYEPEELIGEDMGPFLHPDELERFHNLLVQLHTEDYTVKDFELRFRHRNQSTVQMAWSIYWSGAEQIAFAVGRDITLQKQAEEALQASEHRFRVFMDNNPASAWIADEDGNLVYHNKQNNGKHLLNESDTGTNIFEAFQPEYAAAFRENNQRVLQENQPIEVIELVPLKDGTETIQLVYKFPVNLPGRKRMVGGISIDITRQKKAEQQLQLSEQRFRSFMNNNPAGAWINDAAGTFLFVNEEYNRITRAPRPIREGDRLEDLFDPQLVEQARMTDTALLANGQPQEITSWLSRGDGSTGYFLIYKFPLPSLEGMPLIGGVILDLTEKKKVEEEIERIKKAIDSASDAVLIMDPQLRCIYTNDGFTRLFGYSQRELNQPARSGFLLESARRDREIFTQLRKEGAWEGDLVMKSQSGTPIYVSLRADIIRNEKEEISSYVGVFTDITERVLANRQMKQTADRLTNIMESISEGMTLLNKKLDIEYLNPAAESITGLPVEELIGKNLLTLFPAMQNTPILRYLQRAIREKKALHFEEYFEPLEMWLDVSVYYLNEGLTIYFRNVTERRRAQMQLSLEREAFESITTQRSSFGEIAEKVLINIESIYPGSHCSLLLLTRQNTIHPLAAPSLPEAYNASIEGAPIGPEAGSCGTAMYTRQMVIVSDIATDPRWALYKDHALKFGLRACWSHPLLTAQGKVLGSFAIYYNTIREPEPHEVALVQRVANFLALIYENIESEKLIRLSNERFELATKATNEAIWDWDIKKNEVQWTKAFFTLFGFESMDHKKTLDFWESCLHPEDRDRVVASLGKIIRQRRHNQWAEEYRFRRKDGSYAYVLDKGFVLRDEKGKVYRMVGAMQDISERKQLQQDLLDQQINKQKEMAQVAVEAQEKERAEIGTELHDNVNQLLTTTKLYLELAKNNAEMREDLIGRSAKNISDVIHEIRQLSRSLVPHSITDLGMIAAINDLIETIQLANVIHIRFEHKGALEGPLNNNLKVTIFRIIQEQMNNIIKHAYAQEVLIRLENTGDRIKLMVKDNGAGFDIKKVKRGIGISNIISRADMFNGKATIISRPGKGCKLAVEIPLQA